MHSHHWYMERTTVTWNATWEEHLNLLVPTKHNEIGMKLVKVIGKDSHEAKENYRNLFKMSCVELDKIKKGFSRKLLKGY